MRSCNRMQRAQVQGWCRLHASGTHTTSCLRLYEPMQACCMSRQQAWCVLQMVCGDADSSSVVLTIVDEGHELLLCCLQVCCCLCCLELSLQCCNMLLYLPAGRSTTSGSDTAQVSTPNTCLLHQQHTAAHQQAKRPELASPTRTPSQSLYPGMWATARNVAQVCWFLISWQLLWVQALTGIGWRTGPPTALCRCWMPRHPRPPWQTARLGLQTPPSCSSSCRTGCHAPAQAQEQGWVLSMICAVV